MIKKIAINLIEIEERKYLAEALIKLVTASKIGKKNVIVQESLENVLKIIS